MFLTRFFYLHQYSAEDIHSFFPSRPQSVAASFAEWLQWTSGDMVRNHIQPLRGVKSHVSVQQERAATDFALLLLFAGDTKVKNNEDLSAETLAK